MWEYKKAQAPDILVTEALGPCTGICVYDPDNINVHCYSPGEFQAEGGDLYYWIRLPGPPKEGIYTFTVNFTK